MVARLPVRHTDGARDHHNVPRTAPWRHRGRSREGRPPAPVGQERSGARRPGGGRRARRSRRPHLDGADVRGVLPGVERDVHAQRPRRPRIRPAAPDQARPSDPGRDRVGPGGARLGLRAARRRSRPGLRRQLEARPAAHGLQAADDRVHVPAQAHRDPRRRRRGQRLHRARRGRRRRRRHRALGVVPGRHVVRVAVPGRRASATASCCRSPMARRARRSRSTRSRTCSSS